MRAYADYEYLINGYVLRVEKTGPMLWSWIIFSASNATSSNDIGEGYSRKRDCKSAGIKRIELMTIEDG